MQLLNKFYADFQVKAEVKAYLIEYLSKQAVSKAFAGEDTTGIKEAKECIDSAFRNLDRQFEGKTRKVPQSNK